MISEVVDCLKGKICPRSMKGCSGIVCVDYPKCLYNSVYYRRELNRLQKTMPIHNIMEDMRMEANQR